MAISGDLNNRNKLRSPILLISVSTAAITFLFIFYSSSSSLLKFSFPSPKALKNLLRDRKQRHSLDKYLYWGDRIDCPGKHCDSCEGLGHQESGLRCALEEPLFLQSSIKPNIAMDKEIKKKIVSFIPTNREKSSTEKSQVQSTYVMDFTNVFITEEIFHSQDALVNWARDVGKRNGFVIVIKVSNAAWLGIKAKVVLTCERSGHFKHYKTNDKGPTKKKIKQTRSKKCGCPFTLKGKK